MTSPDSLPIPAVLVAIVAGGAVVNAAIAELPWGKEGRGGYMPAGAVVYAARLLTLAHFGGGL